VDPNDSLSSVHESREAAGGRGGTHSHGSGPTHTRDTMLLQRSTRGAPSAAAAALLLFCSLLLLPTVLGRNYYDILNVPKHAGEQQIKRSYRKLALQYHPDKVSGTEEQKAEAAKRFAEINHAYETLSGALQW